MSLTAIFDSCHSGTLLDLDHYLCNGVYFPWLSRGKRKGKTKWQHVGKGPFTSTVIPVAHAGQPTVRKNARGPFRPFARNFVDVNPSIDATKLNVKVTSLTPKEAAKIDICLFLMHLVLQIVGLTLSRSCAGRHPRPSRPSRVRARAHAEG